MGNFLALEPEQQEKMLAELTLQATAEARRQRKELISGDAGENVFGAGLKAALEYIEKTEKQCLDMFYGTNVRSVEQYRYTITPTASEKNYIVCRYREGVGILPLSDFSGDPIMVIITPTDGDTSSLPFATEKDKVRTEFLVAATCDIELLCGTDSLATLHLLCRQDKGKASIICQKSHNGTIKFLKTQLRSMASHCTTTIRAAQ